MKIVLINYADDNYKNYQNILNLFYKQYFDVISYNILDLDINFITDNQEILSIPKGAGLCIWKSYIILQTFSIINEGDIVLYTDCGDVIYDDRRIKTTYLQNENIFC